MRPAERNLTGAVIMVASAALVIAVIVLLSGCASVAPPQGSSLLPGWVEAITADTMSVTGKQYEVYEWSDGTDFVWFFRLLEVDDE